MAKNAKEKARVKGITTKLGKKSKEELIEIILHKNKTICNLNEQVKNLRTDANTVNEEKTNILKNIESLRSDNRKLLDQIKVATKKADDNYKDSINNSLLLMKETKESTILKRK